MSAGPGELPPPKVTVLTPTLGNRPQMLSEAVESVRAQTFTDWEHVIVDDGSFSVPDFPGTRVVRVTQRGPGPARNAGLGVARGRAIAFLDDDDVWLPIHLETVWEALERLRVDVVYTDCREVGRRDGYSVPVREFDGELLQKESFICLTAALARADPVRAADGFPSGDREDWGLWKRMHALGASFARVPGETVLYRFHTDNRTYGGVDPGRTAEAKRLREEAEAGRLQWDDYARRIVEVWS